MVVKPNIGSHAGIANNPLTFAQAFNLITREPVKQYLTISGTTLSLPKRKSPAEVYMRGSRQSCSVQRARKERVHTRVAGASRAIAIARITTCIRPQFNIDARYIRCDPIRREVRKGALI